ncbi:helix-turn-helix domain-containing protein [Limosilactobacillus equigenerosi]|uniref:helix-turn-helix domain-containing protein n=1 Tax=Limosilactobacillus equigenerosi TaxID=417373 RepID=UPI0021E91E7A|nr:helix-turn-helix transcriptional regulator [Limosilactobacillus equigenerosi]
MSQTELGRLVGVSQTTITAWENNKAEPTSGAVTRLAEIFNISTDYLLGSKKRKYR